MKDFSSIVVSSTVKLLRNLSGFEFPSMLSQTNGVKVLNKLADTILGLDENFKIYKVKTLPELDINIMNEKGLVSRSLIENVDSGAVILSKDESMLVMLNESDHIVEVSTEKGLNLIGAYDKLNNFDNNLLSKLDIAYDDNFGFLTSNVSSVGTGLKASITLFLPALTLTGKLTSIMSNLFTQGVEVVAISDDIQNQSSYNYTIRNTQTIGKKESDIVVKVTEIAIKICELEIRARNELLQPALADEIKDRIFRAWGVLTNCYKIGCSEAQKLLGELKMGVALDLLKFKEMNFIENLMIDIKPYSLTKISGSTVAIAELDKYRARFLTNILKAKRIK